MQIRAGRHKIHSKGFGLTSLSGVRSGFMPPQLKTKQKDFAHILFKFFQFFTGSAAFMFYFTLRFRILRSSYFDIPVEFGMQLNIRPHWLAGHLICFSDLNSCHNVSHIFEKLCIHQLTLKMWIIFLKNSAAIWYDYYHDYYYDSNSD